MKERIAIAGATAVLMAIIFLMLAFFSATFNIALWLEGARLAFCMIAGGIGIVGTILIVAHYTED